MEIRVAPERVFVVTPSVTWDAAKEKAWGQKASVFGALSNLVFRPAADDVQITKSELRYEPFWHVACHSDLEYEVKETLTLPVKNAGTEWVSLDLARDTQLEVKDGSIQLTALAHCKHSQHKDEVVDGMTGKPRPDLVHNLKRPMTELREVDSFAPADAVVWVPEFRSSFLVRQEVGALMTAVQADRIITDVVDVTSIALFFRPVYAFEFLWRSKSKTQSLEIDGVTGESHTTNTTVGSRVSRRLSKELLFDIGADAVDLLVPGGGIAMKVGRAVIRRSESKAPHA
ncbi:MAG: hypothetical protein ACOH16_15325 [Propionibacteriaceae bacterium]